MDRAAHCSRGQGASFEEQVPKFSIRFCRRTSKCRTLDFHKNEASTTTMKSTPGSIASELKRLSASLRRIEKRLQSEPAPSPIHVNDFRQAGDNVRLTAWTVRELINAKQTRRDPGAVLCFVAAERLRPVDELVIRLTEGTARGQTPSRTTINSGKPLGLAGLYEKIQGGCYCSVDPATGPNRQIVDLDKAPRNAQGEVEFSADLYLLKPKDMNKGNGAVLFEVSNRGGKGIVRIVNGADANSEFGDGFLMRQGYTIAWLGWEFDLASRNENVGLRAPIADYAANAI